MHGFLVPGESSLGYTRPVIVTNHGHVGFWFGFHVLHAPEITEYYRLLGKSSLQVFPLQFRSAMPFIGGPIEGTIIGFAYYDDYEVGTIKVIK